MFYLKSINLNNFRCFESKKIEFSPNINVLYGQNAVGKTSVLEGIAYLGILKSFREGKDEEIIRNGQDFFFVSGDFFDDEEEKNINIVVSYNNLGKKIKKNSYIYQKMSDYIGYFNIISFDPGDLMLIKGAPIERRSFLNINISQIDKNYMLSLMKYNKILKKRNEYLKNTDSPMVDYDYLDALTTLLDEEAINIINKREKFVENINDYVNNASLKITKGKESLKLVYSPNISVENIKKDNKNRIKNDILLKKTNCGPHKDDIIILINDKDADSYGSQGQIRTGVISIKIGLSDYMKAINNKQIILLDDVFSELDMDRQRELLNILSEGSQIFITSTDVSNINQAILEKSNLIEFRKEENVWVFSKKTIKN